MTTKYISESEFKVGFDDRFRVDTNDWQGRSTKWLIKGMNLIASNALYNPVAIKMSFEDYILHMPIDMKMIKGITYNGKRLTPTGFTKLEDSSETNTTTYYFLSGKADGTKILVTPDEKPIEMKLPTQSASETTHIKASLLYSYTVMRDDIIRINVPESSGEVILYYMSLPYRLGKSGLLEMLVPDNEFVIEALEWYFLLRLLGRGHKHHVYSARDIEQKWDIHRRRARAVLRSFSLDQREMASRHFRQFITDYTHWARLDNYGV